MIPRCPDCDIEMLNTGSQYLCPWCGGNSITSYYQPPMQSSEYDIIQFRDDMTEALDYLIKAAEENPAIASDLAPVYHRIQERLEKIDCASAWAHETVAGGGR